MKLPVASIRLGHLFSRFFRCRMEKWMLSPRDYLEIFDSVVEFVVIYMVDNFIFAKRTTKMPLHDISMFPVSFTVNDNYSVPAVVYRTTNASGPTSTVARTVHMAPNRPLASPKFLSARLAYNIVHFSTQQVSVVSSKIRKAFYRAKVSFLKFARKSMKLFSASVARYIHWHILAEPHYNTTIFWGQYVN